MKPLKTRAALKWTIALCAIAAFTMMLPQAQGTVSGGLAVGDHHRWMGELFSRDPALMDQSLARFIFPGTHDSGTYGLVYASACEGCSSNVEISRSVSVRWAGRKRRLRAISARRW